VYGAWIAAGIVIGWLASALLARRAPAEPPKPAAKSPDAETPSA
jgi:hypothetical protein